MTLLLLSFLAGILTALAPCVLPLLPIIIGGAAQDHKRRNPYVITFSLAIGIVVFTLLLKFSTAFVNVPEETWSIVSGTIILAFGLTSTFPVLWERINTKFGLGDRSNRLLGASAHTNSRARDVLIGLSLGPVFSSCSPTYFLILATILPRNLAIGIVYLIAYAAGLAIILLLVSILGQRFIRNAAWATDPRGWFKRGLGIIFILVGLAILSGADKRFQTYVAAHAEFTTASIENRLLERTLSPASPSSSPSPSESLATPSTSKPFPRYREIANPAGFVNTDSVKLADLVGRKVVLVDFMTYSCINCIRTFPYLNAWYDTYKDQGLEIVAIHTPEFAFEKNIENVRQAMQRFGIKFPVVLDNAYGTWNAYKNSYWPRKYLIDIDGYIVYDHIGEGGYDETEAKIRELLMEKKVRDHGTTDALTDTFAHPTGTVTSINAQSPETYFGAARNEYLGNGSSGTEGRQNFSASSHAALNELLLDGTWDMQKEFAKNVQPLARVLYRYAAGKLYFVASADGNTRVRVLRDGKPLSADIAGSDIVIEHGQSYLNVHEERLYNLIDDTRGAGEHDLELIIETPGLEAYTFTFG